MTSLIYDPWVAQRLWRRAFVGVRQPSTLDFALDSATIDGERRAIAQEAAPLAPLAQLRRFRLAHDADRRPCADAASPRRRILLIPPFSGGFPVMLRDMVVRLLAEADVDVLEWLNIARALDSTAQFDFDDQIGAIVRAYRRSGGDAHAIAVCQAGPPSVIAAAALEAETPGAGPASLSLISAPLRPSAAPSIVSDSIRARPLEWYRRRLATRVGIESGARRSVYPAEAQMSLMMSTLAAQSPSRDELSRLISRDDGDAPERLSFLEIVTAYMDLPAEHFLSSLERIYLSERGPLDPMIWRGREIPPEALAGLSLAAVEGEKDRVASPGQTFAALDRLPSQDGAMRRRILVPELGHFGLFYGAGWRDAVAPRIIGFMNRVERAALARRRAAEAPSAASSVSTDWDQPPSENKAMTAATTSAPATANAIFHRE